MRSSLHSDVVWFLLRRYHVDFMFDRIKITRFTAPVLDEQSTEIPFAKNVMFSVEHIEKTGMQGKNQTLDTSISDQHEPVQPFFQ